MMQIDILDRIASTSFRDDSWDDLRCRLTDCADEIIRLRAMVDELKDDNTKLIAKEIENNILLKEVKDLYCILPTFGYKTVEKIVKAMKG